MCDQQKIYCRRSALVMLTLSCALAVGTASAGRIDGSKHDFGGLNWSAGEICIVCHTPHNAKTDVETAPLWNHKLTDQTFVMYSSTTLNAQLESQPTGHSMLCLSCHDGQTAIDAYGDDDVGTITISQFNPDTTADLGTDLSNDHPISFVYDSNLASADGALWNPDDAAHQVTIGSGDRERTGTISEVMLYEGYLQCSSCHDVHNNFVSAEGDYLLRISNADSDLCMTCHDK